MKTRLAWLSLATTGILLVAMLFLSLGHEPLLDTLAYGLLALAFAVMGALVVIRQPQNSLGWVFCALGLWGGLIETWEALIYHDLPGGRAGEWVVSWSWIIDVICYALIFLLFPNGRVASPRWRLVLWLLAFGALLAVPGQALSSENAEFTGGRNPLAVDSPLVELAFIVGILLVLAGLIAAVASVAMRYRRAVGIERLQLRLLVFAGSVVVVGMLVAVPLYVAYPAIQAAAALAFLALPIAAGLGILRYRLFDIDLVINRTLVYGTLTALSAGSYAVWVVALQRLLDPLTQGSDLAVAGATLLVASLFRPAHRRVQRVVDRRFYRRSYDAAMAIDAFSTRLRDQIDLDALNSELRAVVHDTMQPAHVSLWLRPAERSS